MWLRWDDDHTLKSAALQFFLASNLLRSGRACVLTPQINWRRGFANILEVYPFDLYVRRYISGFTPNIIFSHEKACFGEFLSFRNGFIWTSKLTDSFALHFTPSLLSLVLNNPSPSNLPNSHFVVILYYPNVNYKQPFILHFFSILSCSYSILFQHFDANKSFWAYFFEQIKWWI